MRMCASVLIVAAAAFLTQARSATWAGSIGVSVWKLKTVST